MFITRRIVPSMAGLAVLLVGASCQTDADVATNPGGSPPAASEPAALVAPVSDRDLRRQRAFAEAIQGLTFEGGLIEVEPVSAPAAARAAERAAEGARRFESNERTRAIKSYVLAVRNAPEDARLYAALGDAFVAKGKLEMAAAAYRTAGRFDDGFVQARVDLATALAMDSRTAEAIEEMQAVLTLDPDHAIAHERLAIWYYYEGSYAAAWTHVGHARRVGHAVPPQFIPLLEKQMPDPAAGP